MNLPAKTLANLPKGSGLIADALAPVLTALSQLSVAVARPAFGGSVGLSGRFEFQPLTRAG